MTTATTTATSSPQVFAAHGLVEVRPSAIEGAGRGLFATRAIQVGEVVTRYGGRRITQRDYFFLDASCSPLVHYVLHLPQPSQDDGEEEEEKVVDGDQPSPIVCPESLDDDHLQVVASEGYCGCFVNDALTVGFGCGTEESAASGAAIEDFVRQVERYAKATLEHGAAASAKKSGQAAPPPWNVRIRWDGAILATHPIAAGEELYLRYGAPYWVTRAYNAALWLPTGGGLEIAHTLRNAAQRVFVSLGLTSSLPPLPPNVEVVEGAKPTLCYAAWGGGCISVEGEGHDAVVRTPGTEVSDLDVLLVALKMFNRDPAIMTMPKALLRRLVCAAFLKASGGA